MHGLYAEKESLIVGHGRVKDAGRGGSRLMYNAIFHFFGKCFHS